MTMSQSYKNCLRLLPFSSTDNISSNSNIAPSASDILKCLSNNQAICLPLRSLPCFSRSSVSRTLICLANSPVVAREKASEILRLKVSCSPSFSSSSRGERTLKIFFLVLKKFFILVYSGPPNHTVRKVWAPLGPQTILCVRFRRLWVPKPYCA